MLLPLFSIFGTGYAQDNNSNSGSNINDTKKEGKGQDNTTINNIISVTIPRGSANPEVNITNLAPRQWYIPRQITVNEGQIVNWTNQDTEAHTIVTGKSVNFIIDFFDPHTNKRLHLLPYDFIISRNGTEIDRISNDFSEVGTDIQKVIFSESGPITIRIENVGDTPAYTQFSTLV